jgi:hypothetical protein
MKVQHLFPANDPLIASHVAMLDVHASNLIPPTSTPSLLSSPDIIHIHGCWQYKEVRLAMIAHRRGARIVFTPHGGLEPWIIKERRLSEKLAKTLLWQRKLAECSYVIIAQGSIEAEALKELAWNPRIETIRNAVITNSITPEAMAQQTKEVYRKVMDSNTLELMSDDTRQLLVVLLKAGITGDRRWTANAQPPSIPEDEWRRLLIYADHENVRTVIDRGLRTLELHAPYIETAHVKSYLPTDYQLPKPTAHDILSLVGEISHRALTLRHLVELDRLLRHPDVNDERINDALDERHQLKYYRRLLQLLTEQTALDEGFLTTEPLDDKQTQRMRNLLKKHLKI